MTWLALADKHVQRFSTHGLGIDQQDTPLTPDGQASILSRGTLLVEATVTGEPRPEPLIGYDRTGLPAQRSFWIQSIPGGGVSLVHALGRTLRHASIEYGGEGRVSNLRISYAWDTSRKWGRLSVERPGQQGVFETAVDDPLPLLVNDLHELIMARSGMSISVGFIALSDQVEPLGLTPTLATDVPVRTVYGYKPAGALRRGDTVLTAAGDHVPVLHSVRRRVPTRGAYRPIRLRAPYFGFQQDITVAPTRQVGHRSRIHLCPTCRVGACGSPGKRDRGYRGTLRTGH